MLSWLLELLQLGWVLLGATAAAPADPVFWIALMAA
jgi:hypothetical protein